MDRDTAPNVLQRRLSRRALLQASSAAALLAACSGGSKAAPTATQPAATELPPAATLATAPTAAASLEEKIGQMLMVGFRGLTIAQSDSFAADIQQHHLGSTVLFDYDVPSASPVRNIQSLDQLAALTAGLQSLASTPLLIATDEEGGQVSRLKEQFGFPPTVSAAYLGAQNDVALTHQYAATMADMLAAAGINLNLAPVVDLNVNPANPIIGALDRSFSADPAVVTQQALEFIRAHHERGVLCTLKHFPGHGSSTQDSHLGFVDVTNTWSERELEPFANIIQAGEADVIMTAHVFNANLDPDYPATLSKPVVTGILRERLGYDGVVITDDMQMRAISDRYGFEAALQLAVEAGADIIAIANNTVFEEGIAARAAGVLIDLVHAGTISEQRIDESVQRIERLKARLAA